MEILLKDGKETLKLPFLPASYEVQSPQNNEVVTTVNGKEKILLGKGGLRTVSWSSWFPKGKPDYLQEKQSYNGKPWSYINKIGKMKGKVITLMITKTPIHFFATIQSFSYSQSDGSGDVHYSIELKEYAPKKKKQDTDKKNTDKDKKKEKVDKKNTKVKKAETKTETKKVTSHTYVVKKGDTLTSIAKKLTGSSANWRAIYNANKKVIGNNPNRILVGMKLVIKV